MVSVYSMQNDLFEIAVRLAVFYVPLLFSLCFHEYAHGWVAKLRGDRTAEMMGRLTLNPVAHMDMIGTVAFPIISIVLGAPYTFGWAKPVPVNTRNLNNPRTDIFWVALAGPLSNIFLALVGAFVWAILKLHFISLYRDSIVNLLQTFIFLNLMLAVFNMIPLHPLDGGKVLARFLPASLNMKLEQNEQVTSILLLVLIFSGLFKFLIIPCHFLMQLFTNIAWGVLA